MYPLPLSKATPVSNHIIGAYRVVILTDCQGIGAIQYAHAAMVYSGDSQRPIFAVASETNALAKLIGGGSHFLCTYDDGHNNFGSSDDWADLGKFTEESLSLITKHFLGSAGDHSRTHEARRLHKLINDYNDASKAIDRKTNPDKYGLIQFELGDAYFNLSSIETESNEPIFESILAYREAYHNLSPDIHPNEYLDALIGLAHNYFNYAVSEPSEKIWIYARDTYQKAIAELLKPAVKRHPTSDRNLALGMSYEALGHVFQNLKQIDDAVHQWRLAQQTYQQYGHNNYVEGVARKIAQNQGESPTKP